LKDGGSLHSKLMSHSDSDEDGDFHDAMTIDGMLSAGLPTSDHDTAADGAPGLNFQSALDHNEAMYRQLLDMIDISKSDTDNDTASEAGDGGGGPAAPEITDPQVLDLFVVFGKPVPPLPSSMLWRIVFAGLSLWFSRAWRKDDAHLLIEVMLTTVCRSPRPPPPHHDQFALDRDFMTTGVAVAALQGGFMGFACLGFFNFFDWSSKTWLGCWEEGAGPWPDSKQQNEYLLGMQNGKGPVMLGTGHWWWILVTMGAGLLIGIIKLVKFVHFPIKPKGLFSEVKELHVEPREAPGIVLCSAISLAAGASVGPEMAMGCLGGGIGTFIAHERNLGQDETYSSTLTGMAAAMGPLLPTPMLTVLLLHELCVVAGRPPKHYMETVCSTGIAATCSWFVYFFFADVTFLESAAIPVAFYDIVKNVRPDPMCALFRANGRGGEVTQSRGGALGL